MAETTETKACPYCGEEILAVAVKCKHCGSDLSQFVASEAAAGLQVDLSNRIREYIAQNRPASPGSWLSGKLYCTPDIPAKKIQVAKNKYAENLSAEEEILALGEDKTFGGAMLTTGLLLTDRALYYYGVDDPKASVMRGARKGFIPLHQIRKIEFKQNSSLEVNGLTSANSTLIPLYFEIGDQGARFMNGLFASLSDLLPELGQNVQRAQQPLPLPAAASVGQHPAPPVNPRNPIEVGEKPKPGCFKIGCGIIAGIIALICLILGIWAAISGLMAH